MISNAVPGANVSVFINVFSERNFMRFLHFHFSLDTGCTKKKDTVTLSHNFRLNSVT